MANFLVEAASKIDELADANLKRRYATALAWSLSFDLSGTSPIRPKSPQNIEDELEILVDDQVEYRISLKRADIRDLMGMYGKKLKTSDLTRNFKTEAYESFFERPISRCANKTKKSATAYTYAEVFQRLGIGQQIDLSQEVDRLFRTVEIVFPVRF